jgi:hypothetical protein
METNLLFEYPYTADGPEWSTGNGRQVSGCKGTQPEPNDQEIGLLKSCIVKR